MFTPTAAQRAAIRLTGTSLLVSAGAGSGKTAVLAERCAYLAAELRPPCPIERLLVVTFTDAAAAEMRQRIGQALRDRLARCGTGILPVEEDTGETPVPHTGWKPVPHGAVPHGHRQDAGATRWLQRQLALLETAQISTIHSFCRQVLNRYFAQAELDPQAPVLDAHDALLLRQETARQVFDRYAEREDARGQAFLDLLAAYGGGGEQPLIERALAVSAFLESIPDPDEWISEPRRRYAGQDRVREPGAAEPSLIRAAPVRKRSSSTGTEPLPYGRGSDGARATAPRQDASASSEALPEYWAERLAEALREELDEQDETVAAELAAIGPAEGPVGQVAAALEEYRRALDGWRKRMWHRPPACDSTGGTPVPQEANQDDCLLSIREYKFPELPRRDAKVKKLGDEVLRRFEAAKERATRVRDKLFEDRLLAGYGRFTAADWAEGIARTRPHVETFLTLVSEVRKAYREAKGELGAVDFADLERMTLKLLRDDGVPTSMPAQKQAWHPGVGVAARLRSQYGHVLVDEFQDTSPIQAEILRLVSRETEAGRAGNLFAVGDVKQSIYRFRLAEPRLFLTRLGKFARLRLPADGSLPEVTGRSGVVIDLTENFRSRPMVIEAINAIFERVMAVDLGGIAYDEDARLKPRPKDKEQDAAPALQKPTAGLPWVSAPVELHILEQHVGGRGGNGGGGDDISADGGEANDDADADGGEALEWEQIQREAYVIAARIKELAAGGTPHKDIVVLLRSMKPRSGLLLRTMSQLGVPVFADSSGGFFEAMEVLDLRALLETLDNEQQDIPLAAVLRSPLFGRALTDDELVEIRTGGGTQPRAAVPHGGRGPTTMPFHEAVREYARTGRNEALRGRLAAILGRLHDWRQRMRRRPLADVVWEIYEESGYLAYVDGLRDGRQRRANLLRLHEYARQFGTFRRQGLNRFLQFMNSLEEASEDLDAGSVAVPSEDVVRVMTIHRAKGLEFPVVVVGELGKRFNLADARGTILFDRRLGVAMKAVDVERRIAYPTLPHRLVSRAAEAESLAEELRVLYVALTRAKEKLILVGTGSPAALERDRQRYAGHEGVVPVLDRRTAQGMLDWVRAAVCCQSLQRVRFGDEEAARESSDALFAVRTYDAAAMSGWVLDPPQARGVGERLERCARMEALGDRAKEGAVAAAVDTVVRRLTTEYPAAGLTRVPAVTAASVLKRRWDARQDEEDPAACGTAALGCAARALGRAPVAAERPVAAAARLFRAPAFVGETRAPEPTRVGTWTHEFLQRLDLTRPCDASTFGSSASS